MMINGVCTNKEHVLRAHELLDITERKRMVKERKRFEERLSALNKYGQSLNMARNLEEVHKVMLEAMKKTLGFEYASILMVHGKTRRWMGAHPQR